MHWYVLLAHPNPESFNHAVCKSFMDGVRASGGECQLNDLYATGFDPLFRGADFNQFSNEGPLPAEVLSEQDKVSAAEGLVLVYPVWWNEAPAILKGWIDRVLSHGFAYQVHEDGSFSGLLKLKRVIILNTADNPVELLEEAGLNQAARLTKADGTFKFCGAESVEQYILGEVSSNEAARAGFLALARDLGRSLK